MAAIPFPQLVEEVGFSLSMEIAESVPILNSAFFVELDGLAGCHHGHNPFKNRVTKAPICRGRSSKNIVVRSRNISGEKATELMILEFTCGS